MYNETTLTVNVDSTSKKLSDTAVNMWIANEVVLELKQPNAPDVESGKSFYAQMTKKVLSEGAQGVTDGYYFTFDTGDVFFSATANGYPELVGDTLNIGTDTPSPSPSGGGVLVVHQSGDDQTGYTLDKTWQEIYDADYSVIVSEGTDSKEYLPITSVHIAEQVYYVEVSNDAYGTTSADGYPQSGGGK